MRAAAHARPAPHAPLRVGVDGRAFEPPRTGVGRYVLEVCRALHELLPSDTQFFVYARRAVPLPVASSRWTLRAERWPALGALPSSVWLKARAGAAARRDALSLFWAVSGLTPGAAWRGPTVSTVYDLCHLVTPETLPRTTRLALDTWFAPDLRRASAVVCISAGTAARLERAIGVRSAAVARPAASAAFRPPPPGERARVRARFDLGRPYFLSVATREPRKNTAGLIAAFARARAQCDAVRAHDMVLVGARGWGNVRHDPIEGVRELGYVDDADLPALYADATAFLFPSRYEGFGLPVREACACGARVIASDLPELREAAGSCSAAFVAPTIPVLADALVHAARHPVDGGGAVTAPGAEDGRAPSWEDAGRVYADLFTRLTDSRA